MAQFPLMQELLILQPSTVRGSVHKEAGLDVLGLAAIVADLEARRSIDFRLSPEEIDNLLIVILRKTPVEDSTFAGDRFGNGNEIGRQARH